MFGSPTGRTILYISTRFVFWDREPGAGWTMLDIPLGLRQALEGGECVLFVGAGLGYHLWRSGVRAPDARTLATELARQFKIDVDGSPELAKVSQIVELRNGRPELEIFLKKLLSDLEPDDVFRWISTVRWRAIFHY